MLTLGPVKSRRLGWSLGVYPVPTRICTFNCVFCPGGGSDIVQTRREEFYPLEVILSEIGEAVDFYRPDYLTILGDGEPTLYWYLGSLLRQAKSRFGIPTAVITNGSLLYRREVRQDLSYADRIIVRIEAIDNTDLQNINRPHESLYFKLIREGFAHLKDELDTRVELEFRLIPGLNDGLECPEKLLILIRELRPAKLYISSPICPPVVDRAGFQSSDTPARILKLAENAVILEPMPFREIKTGRFGDFETVSKEILSRMVIPLEQLRQIALGFHDSGQFEELLRSGTIGVFSDKGIEFGYYPTSDRKKAIQI